MINIITIHGGVNYGAVFQACATNKFLLKHGFDAEVIDYNREFHQKSYCSLHFTFHPTRLLRRIKTSTINKKRVKVFNDFIFKNMNLTKKSYNGFNSIPKEDFNSNDIFLAGSDQIWNLGLTEFNKHYLLDFTDSKNKFSYASSIGQNSISDECKEVLKEHLSKFKKITVREETAKSILSDIGLESSVVCDPTFLLDKEDWESLASKRIIKEKYLLLFIFQKNQPFIDTAIQKAKEEGLKVVSINYVSGKIKGAKNVSVVSPAEWLSLVKNAEYVFTNSFHGLALSINLEKQVFTYNDNNGRISRIIDLTSRLGIEEAVLSKDKLDADYKINYPLSALEEHRAYSKEVLLDMMRKV